MESAVRVPVSRVLAKALQAEGVRGLYRGFLPNALKNLPNKGGAPIARIRMLFSPCSPLASCRSVSYLLC